jgi:hypothetical protein
MALFVTPRANNRKKQYRKQDNTMRLFVRAGKKGAAMSTMEPKTSPT